jgi:uncharacterized protein
MVFDIEKVGSEGLTFNFQIDKDKFQLEQDDCFFNIDVKVRGDLTRVARVIYLKGKVNTELVLKCSRCLEPYVHNVNSNLVARYVSSDCHSASGGEVELHASDIDMEVYKDQTIDLFQAVLDGILLTIPAVCLCNNDCRGICPQCGIIRNHSSCNCNIEPLCDSPFKVLKKLKDKL